MNNYRRNRWLFVITIVGIAAAAVWFDLLVTRLLWDYVTDHMFAGAQAQRLIADTIGWAEAFWLATFGAVVSGVLGLSLVIRRSG